jgi:uncharacterized protein YydD (DUF2326 family)
MQISRVYCSQPELFGPIDFNCTGDTSSINLILAEIRHPRDRARDSHNLGKTTLVHLLDFMMLKDLGSDKTFFLIKHADRFAGVVFFIELALNAGDFLTISRPVSDASAICLKRHSERTQSLRHDDSALWDHFNMSFSAARDLVNAILDLEALSPYDFRKALTYFLRTQSDYRDELQLHKFMLGKDIDWKPFVMHLFSFKEAPVRRKYELDAELEEKRQKREKDALVVQFAESEFPRLRSTIESKRTQLVAVREKVDSFQLGEEEARMLSNLVSTIETRIAELHEEAYDHDIDIQRIEDSLDNELKFNLADIQTIYADAKIFFGDQIRREYGELLAFNKKLTRERNTSLKRSLAALRVQRSTISAELAELTAKRAAQLTHFRGIDTFDKFKVLQSQLVDQRAELTNLELQAEKLRDLAGLTLQISSLARARGEVVDEIKAMLLADTPLRRGFAQCFDAFCQRILQHEGLFFFQQNASGNVEYQIQLTIPAGSARAPSSLDRGTSYKKLLCALFDLALLNVYAGKGFYRFVYHDGVLEGLDNRKKLLFLDLIREQTSKLGIQYIFSAIDSDLPRLEDDTRLQFGTEEIVLRLHDDGDAGRLFRMAEF